MKRIIGAMLALVILALLPLAAEAYQDGEEPAQLPVVLGTEDAVCAPGQRENLCRIPLTIQRNGNVVEGLRIGLAIPTDLKLTEVTLGPALPDSWVLFFNLDIAGEVTVLTFSDFSEGLENDGVIAYIKGHFTKDTQVGVNYKLEEFLLEVGGDGGVLLASEYQPGNFGVFRCGNPWVEGPTENFEEPNVLDIIKIMRVMVKLEQPFIGYDLLADVVHEPTLPPGTVGIQDVIAIARHLVGKPPGVERWRCGIPLEGQPA